MHPTSRLLLPPSTLSGCLMTGIYRDTRGAGLSDRDRISHFPASPLVSLTLVRHGRLHIFPTGQDWRAARDQPPIQTCFIAGPQETPVSSWSPGEIEAITLGIYPDAWFSLGGNAGFAQAPRPLAEALAFFSATHDPQKGWKALCDVLEAEWSKCRPATWHRATNITDWVKSLTIRTAFSGSGRSLRSIERRMKRFSGQTRRSLAFFSAFEQLHRVAQKNADLPLSALAHEAGYADQSHMGRAVRRATGFSPAQLNRAIQNEEAFWCYRLLGERY